MFNALSSDDVGQLWSTKQSASDCQSPILLCPPQVDNKANVAFQTPPPFVSGGGEFVPSPFCNITSPSPYPLALADIPNTQFSPSPDPGYVEKLNNAALMKMACPDPNDDHDLFDTTSKNCF